MSSAEIKVETLGPEAKAYLDLIKGLKADFEARGVLLKGSRTKSEAKWTSVFIEVSPGVELGLVGQLIDLVAALVDPDTSDQPGPDLSIFVRGSDVFFNLPAQRDAFLKRYARASQAASPSSKTPEKDAPAAGKPQRASTKARKGKATKKNDREALID